MECPDCVNGVCSRCDGTGEEITLGGLGHNEPCEKCGGSGDCPRCDGENEI